MPSLPAVTLLSSNSLRAASGQLLMGLLQAGVLQVPLGWDSSLGTAGFGNALPWVMAPGLGAATRSLRSPSTCRGPAVQWERGGGSHG